MDNRIGWNNRSNASWLDVDPRDLDATTDAFEEAALDGDQRTLDRLMDQLRREVRFDDTARGRRLSRLDDELDRLGRAARRDRGGLEEEDNELLQRLRSGLLAGADADDGLRTVLGDVSPEELVRQARAVARKLRRIGRHEAADAVESAAREIGRLARDEIGDVDRMSDDFEDASFDRDGEGMDRIVDRLARRVDHGESRRGRRLARTERALDELGEMARSFEGSDYQQDNDTIQRLRSAVLGAMNPNDALDGPLGDGSRRALVNRARELSRKLRNNGFDRFADHVDRAVRLLERGSGESAQRTRPAPGGWNDEPSGGLERDGDRIITDGGYAIESQGDTEWTITDPNGEMVARIHGDPHVVEGDGTKWDFSKDSKFRLPDGTEIFVDTDYDEDRGRDAVTRRLVIDDGTDRVAIDGIEGADPEIGEIHPAEGDDFESRYGADNPGLDVFDLVSDGDEIAFELISNLGVIEGATLDEHGYEPTGSRSA